MIRAAQVQSVNTLCVCVCVTWTAELQRDGFGPNPFYQCLIAEVPEELKSDEGEKGTSVPNYSTTLNTHLYIFSTCDHLQYNERSVCEREN